jgi:hypothetical protein
MSDDEVMVFIFSLAAGFVGAVTLSPSRLHPFHTQANPGIGLHRLVVLLALLWTAWVIRYHGDPSIVGFYVIFYLLEQGLYIALALAGWFASRWIADHYTQPLAGG